MMARLKQTTINDLIVTNGGNSIQVNRVEVHKGGFYHDGRFATLADVVDHYERVLKLGLSMREKNDLVEYLKSI
jgi:hypothetical protein